MAQMIKWAARQGFPCLFHFLTGLYCPGCGGTRAVRAMLAGDLCLSLKYHPLVLYMAAVATAELASLAISKATKNPRWYLGHETLFVYVGAGIAVANWICKNMLLVFFGVDLLVPWA